EFGLDRLDLICFRSELQRPTPLKPGLGRTPALPIGVAQMVVDRRVLGHQLDRLFEILYGARIIAEPIMGPTQAVDDIAVLRSQLDGLLVLLWAAVLIFAPINPRLAEAGEG